MNKLQRKNFTWNLIGTTINAFTSLFFMMILTRTNGLADAGVFTLAFSIACLICNIGGYEGRVYQVTDVKNEFSNYTYIYHRCITTIFGMFVAILYTIGMHYSLYKALITLILCGVKLMEVLADVFYGILQKNNHLYKVGFSLTLKAVISIICFFIINYCLSNLMLSCLAMLVIWILLFYVYDYRSAKQYINVDKSFQIDQIIGLFKKGFFNFFVIFMSVYVVNASRYALDGRVSSSLQAIFGIIIMPGTVISLCAQYIMHPFLPDLSKNYLKNDRIQFKKVLMKLLACVAFIGLISIFLAYLLGIPVLSLLYSVNLDGYRNSLVIVLMGAIFSALCMIISAALTTIRKTFVQFIIYIIIAFSGFVISPILINICSVNGAFYAYTIVMFMQFVLYLGSYLYFVSNKNWEDISNANG